MAGISAGTGFPGPGTSYHGLAADPIMPAAPSAACFLSRPLTHCHPHDRPRGRPAKNKDHVVPPEAPDPNATVRREMPFGPAPAQGTRTWNPKGAPQRTAPGSTLHDPEPVSDIVEDGLRRRSSPVGGKHRPWWARMVPKELFAWERQSDPFAAAHVG